MSSVSGEVIDMLVVDDDNEFRARLLRAFERRGMRVEGSASVEEARACLESFRPKRAVVDLRMPGESGLELIREMRSLVPETQIVMLTGHGSVTTAVDAMQLGAVSYLMKPADAETILAAFEKNAPPRRQASVASLQEIEWEHIQRVMHECDGNVSRAAKLLGMHRRSLQRKLARGG